MTEALSKLNFRDVGGLPTADGGQLRSGVIYRSEGPASFNDEHRRELAALAIQLVCDLRADVERDAAPNDWTTARLLNLDITNDLRTETNQGWNALRDDPSAAGARVAITTNYAAIPGAILPHLAGLIDAITGGETPVLIHCTAGKDRTGVLMAILLSIVGVPRQAVVDDYLRSDVFAKNLRLGGSIAEAFEKTFGFVPSQATIDTMIGVDIGFLDAALDAIDAEHGSIEGYFTAAGIDVDQLARLRTAMLSDVSLQEVSKDDAMTKAGVIGLGHIGSGVALCLARVGMVDAVYDIRPDAASGLEGVPAVAASPAEVARQCDVVIIAVVSAEQTIAVLTGPDGVLAAARPGLIIVLVATVALDDLTRIRALTDAAGVGLVDCGVTGGQVVRQNGLVCLVGATPEQLAIVRPVLDGFAKSVAHMGGPGAGMAAKIARNVVVFGCIRAGYEGAALARAAGVDVRQLAQVIEESSDGVGGPMMLMGRPADPLTDPEEAKVREYVRNLMNKDLDAALDLGKSLGVGLPLIELVRRTDKVVTGLELAKENAK